MCGIAGAACPERDLAPEAAGRVTRMSSLIGHRGPDGSGMRVFPRAVLAHRRLAVIDLSPAGDQPMTEPGGVVWTVFNGEIFNHHELRRELEAEGWHFRSRADTEVLVVGARAWGVRRLVERLRGMFAFALWDSKAQTLWLVRDRLGVKPLFYLTSRDGQVAFCSEIAPLRAEFPDDAGTLDGQSLHGFLRFGFVPFSDTIWTGIRRVPPATIIEYGSAGLREHRYWSPAAAAASQPLPGNVDDALDACLRDAVGVRLESDVPLGAFLSGGIDSGLVVALASENVPALETLTVHHGNIDDEAALAREVAGRFGTTHREIGLAEPTLERLPELIAKVGEPFADVSLVSTSEVCRAARQTVTVALTGDGGDEVFGGYLRTVAAHMGGRARRVAGAPVLAMLASIGSRATPFRRLATVGAYGSRSPVDLYRWAGAVFDDEVLGGAQAAAEGSDRVRDRLADAVRGLSGFSDGEMFSMLDMLVRLPGQYLVKLDTASSAVGLECRSPFLDQHVVSFGLAIPLSQRLQGGRQKALLRRYARRYLPPSVVTGRKRGFAFDTDRWAARQAKSTFDALGPLKIASSNGVLDAARAADVLGRALAGQPGAGQQAWSLLVLELWWRLFIERSMSPSEPLAVPA